MRSASEFGRQQHDGPAGRRRRLAAGSRAHRLGRRARPGRRATAHGHGVRPSVEALTMDKLAHAAFEERAKAIGSLVRDGRMSSEGASKVLWEDARANGLTGESGSAEEIIEWEIDKAIAIDEGEPRASNGRGREPPPHTDIPDGPGRDR